MEIHTCEMHTGGCPVRIIESGYPDIPGETLLEKRTYVRDNLDHLRKMLIWEPRGHNDMYGALLVPPCHPEADMAVLFVDNEGYGTMCGHVLIALARYAIDKGLVKDVTIPETKVCIECPCGLVQCYTKVCCDGRSDHTRFHSVPAFVFTFDVEIEVEGFGKLSVDISYGGNFYAFLSTEAVGMDIRKSGTGDLVKLAVKVTEAVKTQVKIQHPDSSDLAFLYGTILTDGKDEYCQDPTANLCVFADRQVGRAPCGSGVTARVALQHRRGQISLGQCRQFENAKTGSVFTGSAVRETTCGEFPAVVVEVRGKSWYTGTATFTLEEGDALGRGFLLSKSDQ